MSAVRSKNTNPELLVRRLIFSLGYRFRLHARELPGSPDIIFPAQRKAIFVHGCFWHGHDCPTGKNRPKSNVAYWKDKLARTRVRDKRNQAQMDELDWRVLILWECEIKETLKLGHRLNDFLKIRTVYGPGLSPNAP